MAKLSFKAGNYDAVFFFLVQL